VEILGESIEGTSRIWQVTTTIRQGEREDPTKSEGLHGQHSAPVHRTEAGIHGLGVRLEVARNMMSPP